MERIKKYLLLFLFALVFASIVLFFVFGNLFIIPSLQYKKYQSALSIKSPIDSSYNADQEIKSLTKKIEQLQKKIEKLTPGNAYLIINTTNNTFELFQNSKQIRSGRCSTGSFIHLEVDSTRSFMFETPKGVMTVQNKKVNPVWTKPDWAFIEEGLPVPPRGHSSRFEANVLGDYALILGDGYMIHGTLYQRLIGSPVTHGCVRLLDDDLEVIYKTLQVGSKVYIY